MSKAISAQVGMEFEAAYGYLAMSAWLEGENLPGFAKWMRHQAEEEVGPATRLIDHLLERGGVLALPALSAPDPSFASPLAVAEAALGHEQSVSAAINAMYGLAAEIGDHAAPSAAGHIVMKAERGDRIGEGGRAAAPIARVLKEDVGLAAAREQRGLEKTQVEQLVPH
ncbi:ferritin [bacterium]|nr:ferritin [bacterium]